MAKTTLIVNVSGGLVQDVTYDGDPPDVNLIVIDWDNDGDTNDELIPVTDSIGREHLANVYEETVIPLPAECECRKALDVYLKNNVVSGEK